MLLLVLSLSTVLAAAASPPEPTYGTAVVGGGYDEWDLNADFFANMYEAGQSDKDLMSKLYLRYDCATETVYALVLAKEEGFTPDQTADNAWIRITELGNAPVVDGNSGNDGTPPDFAWTYDGADLVGYEASFSLAPGTYEIEAHINVNGGRTSSTGKSGNRIALELDCSTLFEELTVSKTAETSYTRTHKWSIDKSVKTEFGYEHEGFPKIWLYTDGSGDEPATWTVDVSYEDYEDSGFNVSGDITVENTGTLDAVITDITDVLAGTEISVDCSGVVFPYTLGVGNTLTCSYNVNVDDKISGKNKVDVTTKVRTYSAEAAVIWGEPTSEVNASVTIKDVSDLFGEVVLGTLDAPNGGQFTYFKDFAWAGYGQDGGGDYVYGNTATIVETGQSADATLKVNVQRYLFETAFAKGSDAECFIDHGFDRWGWTNPILPGTYTWDLWAGAGQCDTSKGILVGSVTVVYDAASGNVTVTYDVNTLYLLDETHVYADYGMFPVGKRGALTVAPGKYYNASPFDGSEVYVIAHAVVGIPDPDFGP
jgi:hypothetical protein